MTSPCLGPEFALDSGDRIVVDLCGPPNQQDWPFDCAARLNNGLHRTENGCLWTARQASGFAMVAAGAASCAFFCGYSATSSVYSNNVVSLTVTNTDLCRYRSYLVHTDYNFKTTFASGGGVVNYHRFVTGVDGADAGWFLVQTLDAGVADGARANPSDVWSISNLAPGASTTVKIGMRVNAASGTGTVNTFDARIGVFGIASD